MPNIKDLSTQNIAYYPSSISPHPHSTKLYVAEIDTQVVLFLEHMMLLHISRPLYMLALCLASQVALVVKNPLANAGAAEDAGSILGQENPLEEGTATHLSLLAQRILWMEKPGGLQPMGSQRAGHG